MPKQKPVHEVRLGSVKAAIWENQTDNGPRFNVTVSRIYKDGDEWKSTVLRVTTRRQRREAQAQFATNFLGALNVTRAALPVMRSARKGRIFNVSSLGGLLGVQFGSLYCATKFALEGFSESLAKEIAPFGILVTIIEPGPFRTDFLTPESLHHGDARIADYDDRRAQLRAAYVDRGGLQPGDPAKLAEALVQLANDPQPPMRFLAGAIAVQAAEDKLAGMRAEIDHWRQLSVGTDGNYATSDAQGLIAQIK